MKTESDIIIEGKILNPHTQYLEGPNSRGKEFSFTLKVLRQFIKGFRKLHFIGPCVTVFGSARLKEDHPYYILTRSLSASLSKMGFTIMTGGGPGIMEAANRGAYEAGGKSIGCTIKLPKEQNINPYMHKWIKLDYFFVRKVLLLKYSYAFIVMPGGFGTLDELFETTTLIQTGIISRFPIVVFGRDYYKEIEYFIGKMIDETTISTQDAELILFTDEMDEALLHISKYIDLNYQVKNKIKPRWWLGESG